MYVHMHSNQSADFTEIWQEHHAVCFVLSSLFVFSTVSVVGIATSYGLDD
jgi:hypothetical protein